FVGWKGYNFGEKKVGATLYVFIRGPHTAAGLRGRRGDPRAASLVGGGSDRPAHAAPLRSLPPHRQVGPHDPPPLLPRRTPAAPAELFKQHRQAVPPPIAERSPGVVVPPALEAVVQRLLEKDPDVRYPHARSVIVALDAAMQEAEVIVPVAAPPPSGADLERH